MIHIFIFIFLLFSLSKTSSAATRAHVCRVCARAQHKFIHTICRQRALHARNINSKKNPKKILLKWKRLQANSSDSSLYTNKNNRNNHLAAENRFISGNYRQRNGYVCKHYFKWTACAHTRSMLCQSGIIFVKFRLHYVTGSLESALTDWLAGWPQAMSRQSRIGRRRFGGSNRLSFARMDVCHRNAFAESTQVDLTDAKLSVVLPVRTCRSARCSAFVHYHPQPTHIDAYFRTIFVFEFYFAQSHSVDSVISATISVIPSVRRLILLFHRFSVCSQTNTKRDIHAFLRTPDWQDAIFYSLSFVCHRRCRRLLLCAHFTSNPWVSL